MVWAVSLSTMELIPHCLTPEQNLEAFVFWLDLVSSRPLIHPVTFLPKLSYKAAPKCISGRTSYLQVRLAFHLYPQLIPAICNLHGFGPSPRDYRGFTLAMGSSPGFGSAKRDYMPYSDSLSLRLPPATELTLPRPATRRLILQ